MVGKNEEKSKPKESSEVKSRTKSPGRTKSPARPKSPGRPKNPIRSRSPGSRPKSPGRPKSPAKIRSPASPKRSPRKKSVGRKPVAREVVDKSPTRTDKPSKSPARKSPARKSPARKSPTRKTPTKKLSARKLIKPETTEKKSLIEIESDSEEEERHLINKYLQNSRRTPIKETSIEKTSNILRRSSRVKTFDTGKINYEPFVKLTNNLTEFSDEDEFNNGKKNVEDLLPTSFQSKSDYLGILSIILEFTFLLALLFWMLFTCDDISCNFKLPLLKQFKTLPRYFDLSVFLSFTAYTLFIAIISALPFGGKRYTGLPNKNVKLVYTMNGLFCLLTILAIAIGLELNHFQVFNYIHANFYKIVVSGLILSLPIGIILYIKHFYTSASNLNSEYIKKSALHIFYYGSEINPRLFGVLDVKITLFRISMISLFLMTFSCLYQNFDVTYYTPKINETSWMPPVDSVKLRNPTLLTICIMFMIYIGDLFIFENVALSTAEVQYESLGFKKCVEYISFIFLFSAIPKYVLDYDVYLDTWKLAMALATFVIGYVLYRGSNYQKHLFRENPYSPKVSYLESIPTSTGRKLICSSYWGLVRHPNYLGDIIMSLSYLPFVLCNPPCMVIYFTLFHLLQRSIKDNKRCKERYGVAWDRYCQRVKYVLIPKIY